jgi:hypothetical protein
MSRWWLHLALTAVVIWLIGLISALAAGRWADRAAVTQRKAETEAAAAAVQQPPPPDRPHVGFSVKLFYTNQPGLYLKAIDDLAGMGFTSVQIVTPAFQRDGAATDIRIDATPGRSARRQDLLALLQHAKRRNLRTALMPVVLLTNPRGDEWRGKIQPERWEPWWESYGRVIDHFTDVANEAGVDELCVGSELNSTQPMIDQWTRLIERVRGRFAGRLYYSANWDSYTAVDFWPSLDAIGVNGYFDLTAGASGEPTAEALAARWAGHRDWLLRFAQAQRRPLLLTEIGYPSQAQALRAPWDYTTGRDKPADHAAQARGYAAFLEAWGPLLTGDSPRSPMLAGVFFYEWDPAGAGGARDVGYGVIGKPAHGLLRDFLQESGVRSQRTGS